MKSVQKLRVNENKQTEYMSGAVHTGVKVRRMDTEMSGLVE